MRQPVIFWFLTPAPPPQGPMDPTGGGGTSADIVPAQIIFSVDPCTRCWDIAQKPPKCKNSLLTPIVTPTPKLARSRSWCLLYPEPKFHGDRTILRWDILNRTNKQKKLNITPNATLLWDNKSWYFFKYQKYRKYQKYHDIFAWKYHDTITIYSVSQKTWPLQLICHTSNFINSQHSLIFFGTERPYIILHWLG